MKLSLVLMLALSSLLSCRTPTGPAASTAKDITLGSGLHHVFRLRSGGVMKMRCTQRLPAQNGWIERTYDHQCTPVDDIEMNAFRGV